MYSIHARYMQDTGTFFDAPACYMKKLKLYMCICVYMYVYVYMTFIRACIYRGSSYVTVSVRICMYLHVDACIWDTYLYLNPLLTEICWNEYMHVWV